MLIERSSALAVRPTATGGRVASGAACRRRLRHSTNSDRKSMTTSSRSTPVTSRRPLLSSSSSSPSLSAARLTSAVALRHASSSSTPSTPSSAVSADRSAILTWNQFLQLRKSRRRYNLVASVGTGLGTAFTGAGYLSTIDLNQLSGVLFGLDPFMALGLSTMACGALGWLIGPLAGSALFNTLHRSSAKEMLVKEKDFYHRILRYRADISAGGNLQNTPFPDYYGEKINSVAAYRQWLRDQRKFSKKREYRPR